MNPGYFRWNFHSFIRTSPLSLWVLAYIDYGQFQIVCGIHNCTKEKEYLSLFWSSMSPVMRTPNGLALRVPFWWRGDSAPANQGYREAWWLSQIENGFGLQVNQVLIKGAYWCLDVNSIRYEESRTSFAKCPQERVQMSTTPSNAEDLAFQVWPSAGKQILARALM